jgi:hypothetical protein
VQEGTENLTLCNEEWWWSSEQQWRVIFKDYVVGHLKDETWMWQLGTIKRKVPEPECKNGILVKNFISHVVDTRRRATAPAFFVFI